MDSPQPSAHVARVRRRIVDAAIAAMADLSSSDLLSAVGSRAIARRAEVSAATLFHHFGSIDGLARAVEDRLYSVEAFPEGLTATGITDFAGGGPDPLAATMDLHRSLLELVAGSADSRLRIGMWSFGGVRARTLHARYFRELEARLDPFLSELTHRWGRTARPPFDAGRLVAAHAAMVLGSTIRHTADPDTWTADDHARVTTALGLSLLRDVDDHRDFDTRLIELLPRRSKGTLSATRAATRDRLIAAAQACFAEHGYDQTTVSQIASDAHVSVSTLYDMFDGKSDLAASAVVADAARQFGRERERVPLGEALEVAADFFEPHHRYLAPYLSEVVSVGPRRATDGLFQWLASTVRADREAGLIRPDVSAVGVTRTALLLVGSNAIDPPPAGAAAVYYSVLLRGLAPDAS